MIQSGRARYKLTQWMQLGTDKRHRFPCPKLSRCVSNARSDSDTCHSTVQYLHASQDALHPVFCQHAASHLFTTKLSRRSPRNTVAPHHVGQRGSRWPDCRFWRCRSGDSRPNSNFHTWCGLNNRFRRFGRRIPRSTRPTWPLSHGARPCVYPNRIYARGHCVGGSNVAAGAVCVTSPRI